MRTSLVALALTAVALAPAFGNSASPYAGEAAREIKALSSVEIADLLAGRGSGYARTAELNGYPGPLHVLQLADTLQLSTDQRRETRVIFERMTASAKAVGVRLVEAERALESSFQNRDVSLELLARRLDEIAGLQSSLRNIHLRAHLEQTALLTSDQISRYVALRGYRKDLDEHLDPHAHE